MLNSIIIFIFCRKSLGYFEYFLYLCTWNNNQSNHKYDNRKFNLRSSTYRTETWILRKRNPTPDERLPLHARDLQRTGDSSLPCRTLHWCLFLRHIDDTMHLSVLPSSWGAAPIELWRSIHPPWYLSLSTTEPAPGLSGPCSQLHQGLALLNNRCSSTLDGVWQPKGPRYNLTYQWTHHS